ncbi:unnamed protein product [Closterium sp. Yama58-4]|nr:unnamed protein product [Closterium sp. Yama58-4]
MAPQLVLMVRSSLSLARVLKSDSAYETLQFTNAAVGLLTSTAVSFKRRLLVRRPPLLRTSLRVALVSVTFGKPWIPILSDSLIPAFPSYHPPHLLIPVSSHPSTFIVSPNPVTLTTTPFPSHSLIPLTLSHFLHPTLLIPLTLSHCIRPIPACQVAEKPSIALTIAQVMSHGQMASRRSWLDVHEFNGDFRGGPARFKVTSVIGHVLRFLKIFPALALCCAFLPCVLRCCAVLHGDVQCGVVQAHVCKHLQMEAKGCDALVLWLDCDREGENICFEVMAHTQPGMRSPQNVYRAKFSAIGEKDIRQAMARLGAPNEAEARAVDARQEIDLKVGVAFTRFQTRFFQGKYGNLDSSLISYGPCQTPTLGFCVARHQRITSFVSEPFWAVRPIVVRDGRQLALQWGRGRLFDKEVAEFFQRDVAAGGAAVVKSVAMKEERKGRPTGLNTVEMLKAASSGLGMGPHHAMQIAERLYTQGYIR